MTYLGNAEYQRLYFEGIRSSSDLKKTLGGLVTVDDEFQVSVNVETMYGQVWVEVQHVEIEPESLNREYPDVTELGVLKEAECEAKLVNGSGDEIQEPDILLPYEVVGRFRMRVHRKGEGFADGQEPVGPEDPRTEKVLVLVWPEVSPKPSAVLSMNSPFASETQRFADVYGGDLGFSVEEEADS